MRTLSAVCTLSMRLSARADLCLRLCPAYHPGPDPAAAATLSPFGVGSPLPVPEVLPLETLDDTLRTPSYTFRLVETPGHTRDPISLFEPQQRWLFSGDAFMGGHERHGRARPICLACWAVCTPWSLCAPNGFSRAAARCVATPSRSWPRRSTGSNDCAGKWRGWMRSGWRWTRSLPVSSPTRLGGYCRCGGGRADILPRSI